MSDAACRCLEFGEYVEVWFDEAPLFDVGYVTLESRCDVELRQCEACGTHWQVDIGRGGLAARVHEPESWNDFDDRPIRLQQLVDSHGGLEDDPCQWAGCERPRLKGTVLCPHHIYPQLSDEVDE